MLRKTLTSVVTAGVLAAPVVDATAATARTIVATKKFTGPAVDADRWGPLQVTITVRKTTKITGTRKKVTRRITAVSVPVSPNHTDRSIFINQRAIPILRSEALQAQTANIDLVSGATNSSDAFTQSLQAAILKERHW